MIKDERRCLYGANHYTVDTTPTQVILSSLIKLLSLSNNSFLVFSVATVLWALDRFSGCLRVKLCHVMKLLYNSFDGKVFFKTCKTNLGGGKDT